MGEKTFSFETDNDQNGYVSFEITEFSKIKVLTTPEEPETSEYLISAVDSNEKIVTIESPAKGSSVLVLARYNGNKLLNAWFVDVQLEPGENSISINDLPAPVQGIN